MSATLPCRCASRRNSRCSIAPAQQVGYFDELYDLIFVRPAKWLGRFCGAPVTLGKIIDGMGPDGISARVLDTTSWVCGCRRLRLSLPLHHARRCRRAGDLVSDRGGPLMFGFGILSGLLILPLIGAASSSPCAVTRLRSATMRVGGTGDDDRHLPALAGRLGAVRYGQPGFPACGNPMPG